MDQFIWGLYFEHGFDAGRFFIVSFCSGVAIIVLSIIVIFIYWKVTGDWVGSSNIGQYILGFGVLLISIALVFGK
jgi:hypothetical protein